MGAGLHVHFPDRCPATLYFHPAFGHVAVGSHADIQRAAIRTGQQILRPVVIDRAARQVQQLRSCCCDGCVACPVRKTQHRVGVGHKQPVADQGHAER